MAELRRNAANKESADNEETTPSFTSSQKEGQIRKLQEELYCFLNRQTVTESISENRSAVYRLITSHADFETQLYIATKLKDSDVVVKIHLLRKEYDKALEIIGAQSDALLFYKYSEDLFEHVPREFVKTLINAGRLINKPRQIISIFFNCHKNKDKVSSSLDSK